PTTSARSSACIWTTSPRSPPRRRPRRSFPPRRRTATARPRRNTPRPRRNRAPSRRHPPSGRGLLGRTGGTVAVMLRRRRQKNPDGSMTLVEHLDELRTRLIISVAAVIVGMAVAWPLYRPVFNLLTNPYCNFMKHHPQLALHPQNPCALAYISIVEPFLVKIKTVGALGLCLALPVVLYEIWRFVTPGLKSNERRYAIPFVLASIALFVLGGYFALITLPKGLAFLLGFAGTSRIYTVLSVGKYVGFVTLLILAFGASFEFPLLLISLTM